MQHYSPKIRGKFITCKLILSSSDWFWLWLPDIAGCISTDVLNSDIVSNLSRLISHWTKESIHPKCQQAHVQFGKNCLLSLNDTFFTKFSGNPDRKYHQNITWKIATQHRHVMIWYRDTFRWWSWHWVKPTRWIECLDQDLWLQENRKDINIMACSGAESLALAPDVRGACFWTSHQVHPYLFVPSFLPSFSPFPISIYFQIRVITCGILTYIHFLLLRLLFLRPSSLSFACYLTAIQPWA